MGLEISCSCPTVSIFQSRNCKQRNNIICEIVSTNLEGKLQAAMQAYLRYLIQYPAICISFCFCSCPWQNSRADWSLCTVQIRRSCDVRIMHFHVVFVLSYSDLRAPWFAYRGSRFSLSSKGQILFQKLLVAGYCPLSSYSVHSCCLGVCYFKIKYIKKAKKVLTANVSFSLN